jgi:hypothetical protein
MSEKEWCAENPDEVDWFEPTGYRKVPLSTCQGGRELDKASTPRPCPGKEDEFEREHAGPSGAVVFFAIIIPCAAAAAVGWWVWRNWSGKFGQIRLGEPGAGGVAGVGGAGALLDADAPWIRYPVIAVSAVVAVAVAVPALLAALWRTTASAAERWGIGGGAGGRGAWSRLPGGGSGLGGSRRFTTRDSFARGRDDYAVVDEDEGELLGDDSDEEV